MFSGSLLELAGWNGQVLTQAAKQRLACGVNGQTCLWLILCMQSKHHKVYADGCGLTHLITTVPSIPILLNKNTHIHTNKYSTHTHKHQPTHTKTCRHTVTHVQTETHQPTQTEMNAHKHRRTHIRTNTPTHILKHTDTHINIQTHMHTHSLTLSHLSH